jgi:Ca-activated chloride channel family protein
MTRRSPVLALFCALALLPFGCASNEATTRHDAPYSPPPSGSSAAGDEADTPAPVAEPEADDEAGASAPEASVRRSMPRERVAAEAEGGEDSGLLSSMVDGAGALAGALLGPSTPAKKKEDRIAQATPPPPPADPVIEPMPGEQPGGTFVNHGVNPFVRTEEDRLSTFAIDVDTGSYTYARRFLRQGQAPAPGSVRVEEWINAFHYDYPSPEGEHPFAIHMQAGPSPLSDDTQILRVGIQGDRLTERERKRVNLTFLVDVSGSMSSADKLPMAQQALEVLVGNLRDDDSVALVTYAGHTGVVLEQTKIGGNRERIISAIHHLRSGGGTAMSSGMQLAYENAHKFLDGESVSRVIVLSDGDANIGHTGHSDMLRQIRGYVSEGVTLSTVGLGNGNYRDHLMEQLANAGNGNYSYIDSIDAAEKLFGTDLVGTLQVIAKDVKIQVEMNPEVVAAYRLLGYENRDIADKDFRNDKVDAGEIGAGHSVTALYEVKLQPGVAGWATEEGRAELASDIATVRVRYKQPRGEVATEVTEAFTAAHVKSSFSHLDHNTRFAAAVSLASEIFRGSPYAEGRSLEDAYRLASQSAAGPTPEERREFVELLRRNMASFDRPVASR